MIGVILVIIIIFSYLLKSGPARATCTLFTFGEVAQKVGKAEFRELYPFGPVEITINAEFGQELSGPKGIHIHESGDLSAGCGSTCAHYNPFGASHGGRGNSIFSRHVGDLGNVQCNNGIIRARFIDKIISLRGPFSIVGRSLVIHADEDDLGQGNHEDSHITGHSGARIACGVIGKLRC